MLAFGNPHSEQVDPQQRTGARRIGWDGLVRLRRSLDSERFGLFIVLLAGIGLRFWELGQPQLWLDEIIQITRFSHADLKSSLLDLREEVAAAPLDYLIQRSVIALAGTSDAAARFHAAAFGSLSLLAFYRLGVLLAPASLVGAAGFPSPALAATAIMAAFPLHIAYSQEGRPYSLLFLLTVCGAVAALEAVLRGGRIWLIHWFFSVLLLYSSYQAVLALLGQAALLLGLMLLRRERPHAVRPRDLLPFAISASAAVTCFLPWLLWSFQSTQSSFQENFFSFGFLLRLLKESSGGSLPLSLLLLGLLAAGLRPGRPRDQRATVAILLSWFLIPLLAVLLLDHFRGYFFAIRQLLFAMPPLLIGVGIGLKTLRPRLGVLAAGACFLLGVGTIAISDRKAQADWLGAAAYLSSHVQAGEWVAAPNIERPLSFRCPPIRDRFVQLDHLDAVSQRPATIHVVESRYATPPQSEAIRRLSLDQRCEDSFTGTGFRICSLTLSD